MKSRYIVDLLKRVTRVCLENNKIVQAMPALNTWKHPQDFAKTALALRSHPPIVAGS